jgi:hypothetical protein
VRGKSISTPWRKYTAKKSNGKANCTMSDCILMIAVTLDNVDVWPEQFV